MLYCYQLSNITHFKFIGHCALFAVACNSFGALKLRHAIHLDINSLDLKKQITTCDLSCSVKNSFLLLCNLSLLL